MILLHFKQFLFTTTENKFAIFDYQNLHYNFCVFFVSIITQKSLRKFIKNFKVLHYLLLHFHKVIINIYFFNHFKSVVWLERKFKSVIKIRRTDQQTGSIQNHITEFYIGRLIFLTTFKENGTIMKVGH